MRLHRLGMLCCCLVVAILASTVDAVSQAKDSVQCIPCGRPQDNSFNVRLKGGRTDPGRQFVSIVRDTTYIAGELVQGCRVTYIENGKRKDTVVQTQHHDALVMGITLGKVPPLHVAVLPVREYQLDREPVVKTSFAEVSAFLGYAGDDESTESPEQIGINTFYYGGSILVAPFGQLLGDKLSLGIGASALMEGGRLRIPAYGHLRYTFTSTRIENSVQFVPSQCQFACAGQPVDTIQIDTAFKQRPGPDSVDPSAALIMKRIAVRDTLAPYVYLEGGLIFNGSFEGAGSEPSINPDEYGQYMAGAGVGIPIIPILHASLGYRFMRLNVRTPCENCDAVFQVNTNVVHSIMLRIALHFGW